MRVYIAGPLTHGDRQKNVEIAERLMIRLIKAGHTPYCPHLSWYVGETKVHYEEWMRVDLDWVRQCEAVIRLPGYSPGGDRETTIAARSMIPVYSEQEFFEVVG